MTKPMREMLKGSYVALPVDGRGTALLPIVDVTIDLVDGKACYIVKIDDAKIL